MKVITEKLEGTDKAKAALRYLIDVHAKLIGGSYPFYGSIFAWDWFELNTSVTSSLGDLQSALSSHKKRLQDSMTRTQTYISNLEGNLRVLERLSCSLAAHWKGSVSANGTTFPMAILVTNQNGQWGGQINLNDGGDSLRNIVVQNNSLRFAVGQGAQTMNFSGTMSADGAVLSGTFTSSAGPSGTFSLRRQ